MTAVAGSAFTAAQFNTYVRDNLLETAPAKATAAGRYFVTTGANAIVERIPTSTFQANVGTTTSTSYTATLSGTPGTNPSVTVTTGTTAFICLSAQMDVNYDSGSTGTLWAMMSYAVSGATTIAATEDTGITFRNNTGEAGQAVRNGAGHLLTGLTAGSNTFTLQYKTSASSSTCRASFQRRDITVLPL
ncbi:hypothetical protein ACWD2L_05905 [Streptomyces sp. NPDC002754]